MKRGTLYITDTDCELRCAGPWLRLERDGECLARAATAALGHVMLIGDVLLTPGAINTLLRHKVPVSFLDRRGQFRGRLVSAEAPTPSLRQAQYRCAEDPLYALGFARVIVSAKIASAQALLRRHSRNCDDPIRHPDLRGFADQAEAAQSLSALRGIEGRAAATYFAALRACLKRPAFFPARMRRPPTDPINALLSFGYSILTAHLDAELLALREQLRTGCYVPRAYRVVRFPKPGGGTRVLQIDDFLVLCRSERACLAAMAEVEEGLAAIGLELNPAKSALSDFGLGFDFLGARFVGSFVISHSAPPYGRKKNLSRRRRTVRKLEYIF